MKLSKLFYTARHALRTEKGRQAAGRATDSAAEAARKFAPKHRARIDKAQQSARRYLDRT